MQNAGGFSRKLAPYYDLLYSWKDYAGEAVRISQLVRKFKRTDGNELLDVACGTGKHIQYLKRDFSCTGVDLNPGMLDVARKNNPGVMFHRADMKSFNLGQEYDAIVCLFSAIGYVKSYTNLRRTLRNFACHLKIGGVVIIEPWLTKTAYVQGAPHMSTYDGEDLKIARCNVSRARGNLSIIEMHYLIAERDKGVWHRVELHKLAMFEPDRVLTLMDKAGFRAKLMKRGFSDNRSRNDRGLYVGVKRSSTATPAR